MSLDIGDAVPQFALPTDSGGTLSLADIKGGTTVMYFYPKDNTSGCTKEALAFRDAADDFDAAGARVIGVSPDGAVSHDKFKSRYDLNFTLVADEDKSLSRAFGVWVEKSMYGKKYMGVERSTFLVDGDGMVCQVWRKVKVPGHVAAVLDAARALSENA